MKKYKQLESSCGDDVLRSLPKNVLEAILTCLPIKDVVRTSILSRSWRYEWTTHPNIIFNATSFPCPEGEDQIEFDRKIAKIVDHILLLHQGPIHKFEFSVEIEDCADIDRWVLYLSRHGIRNFTLNKIKEDNYTLPSCLFSCTDMTYFELFGCNFFPPLSFRGFSKLIEMDIQCVHFAEHGLPALMSHLPHLKILIFKNNCGFKRLEICAEKLEYLILEGAFEDIHFKSAPLLAEVDINLSSMASESYCSILKVLGSLPSISRLELLELTLQNLAVGDVPEHIHASSPLKHLIVDINFQDVKQMLGAFCILRSAPLLQKLDIQTISTKNAAAISSECFWDGREEFCCTFNHLQVVLVYNFTGTPSEVKFIKYVLANAPVLEKMRVEFQDNVANILNIVIEMMRFRRLSPNAEVVVIE